MSYKIIWRSLILSEYHYLSTQHPNALTTFPYVRTTLNISLPFNSAVALATIHEQSFPLSHYLISTEAKITTSLIHKNEENLRVSVH